MNRKQWRILALAGSLRRNSFNRMLLYAAADCAPASMRVSIFDDLASVPLFNEDLEGEGGPKPVAQLRQAVASAHGLLIATPEYNHSVPGVLKNAIDWLSRPAPEEVLVGKPVAIVGVTSGLWGTRLAQAALRQILYATGSQVVPGPALYITAAHTHFDANGRLPDDTVRAALQDQLGRFDDWIECCIGVDPALRPIS